jgi:hypothetical protein
MAEQFAVFTSFDGANRAILGSVLYLWDGTVIFLRAIIQFF